MRKKTIKKRKQKTKKKKKKKKEERGIECFIFFNVFNEKYLISLAWKKYNAIFNA